MTSRHLSEAIKKKVAAKQHFRCANRPGVNIKGLNDYECLLWKSDDLKGSFDGSGYQIDHIEEFCISRNNDINNLQALCHNCHAYKTADFQMNRPKRIYKKNHTKNSSEDSSENFSEDLSEDFSEDSSEDCSEDCSEKINEDSNKDPEKITKENPEKEITDHLNKISDPFEHVTKTKQQLNFKSDNLNINAMYQCKRCKKVFDRKSNYERHINRVFKCSPCNSNKTSKKSIIPQCPYCGKTFTRPYGIKKHLAVCKK